MLKRWPDIMFIGGAVVIFIFLMAWTNRPAPDDGITWHVRLADAQHAARASRKPIFVKFTTTWCPPCREMDRSTFPDEKVRASLASFEPVKVDGDDHPDLMRQYGIRAYPTMLVLSPDGETLGRVEGGLSAEQLIRFLDAVPVDGSL
ncbi:MAG: thioredoxin family protein [Phycisphaerales bacterium]|nr:thioredoxin family protein [Phycisphaerales bacterium]